MRSRVAKRVGIVSAPGSRETCPVLFETSSNRRTRQASARLHFRGVAKYVCKLFKIVPPIVACTGQKGSTTRGRAPHGRESKSSDRDHHRFETVRSRQARDEQSDRHLIEQERLVAEGLLLRAAAGRDGDSNDWDVSGSVRHSKNHLAECDWIRFDRQI
ncbi:pantoate--beta-alanine ligase [Bradyrhizobium hipponense]